LGARLHSGETLSPSLQLTPLWGKTGVTGAASSLGEFAWTLGRVEACPLSFQVAAPVRIDPCAALEVGRLTASGKRGAVKVPGTVKRWWVAPGASLALHLTYQGWFLRLGGIALAPATRDEFVFTEPNRAVHQASRVVLGAFLALGCQWGREQIQSGRP
jgi:hypothetical protein